MTNLVSEYMFYAKKQALHLMTTWIMQKKCLFLIILFFPFQSMHPR